MRIKILKIIQAWDIHLSPEEDYQYLLGCHATYQLRGDSVSFHKSTPEELLFLILKMEVCLKQKKYLAWLTTQLLRALQIILSIATPRSLYRQ